LEPLPEGLQSFSDYKGHFKVMKRIVSLIFLYLFVLAPLGAEAQTLAPSLERSQAQTREKPKLRDFGSSLRRLKWDERKKAAVETKQKREKVKGSSDEDVIRVETTLVVSDVLVMDERGRPVLGLTRDDFVVAEDAKPQVISTFSLGDSADVPRSIVLVIDYSPSQNPFIKTSIAAAKTLVDKLGPRDRMAIVTDSVELLADFTQDKDTLKKRLDSLERGAGSGRSLQFTALMASLREMFSEEDVRPIIIFQTDGDELDELRPMKGTPFVWPNRYSMVNPQAFREFSLEDIWDTAERSRVTVYSVISGIRLIAVPEAEQLERAKRVTELLFKPGRVRQEIEKKLERGRIDLKAEFPGIIRRQLAVATIAQVTGGWTEFLEGPAQAETVYSRVFADINQRYIIGYYPTNKNHDGKRRNVKVTVRDHPEYIVWGRKAYYAPEPEE
jgi:VWFA-related protein